jgi:hypothetical protein
MENAYNNKVYAMIKSGIIYTYSLNLSTEISVLTVF